MPGLDPGIFFASIISVIAVSCPAMMIVYQPV